MDIIKITKIESYTHRIEIFFINNYDRLMIEEGSILKDMVYVK